jgi:hypothetical protein
MDFVYLPRCQLASKGFDEHACISDYGVQRAFTRREQESV